MVCLGLTGFLAVLPALPASLQPWPLAAFGCSDDAAVAVDGERLVGKARHSQQANLAKAKHKATNNKSAVYYKVAMCYTAKGRPPPRSLISICSAAPRSPIIFSHVPLVPHANTHMHTSCNRDPCLLFRGKRRSLRIGCIVAWSSHFFRADQRD